MADQTKTNVELAASLTIAWLNNPNVRATTDDATSFLENIHTTLRGLGSPEGTDEPSATDAGSNSEHLQPAVTVRKSLAKPDRIISMIDGKPYATLKRHLSRHGLTPQQYRERYGLKTDYPMVAPAYAERRREMAKKIGLGRKPAAGAASRRGKRPTKKAG